MSKKNSNVILSNGFRKFKDLSEVYLNFKDKLKNLKNRSCLVAVSGGPDSLALVALSQAFSFEKKIKFFYVLINHNIRANSSKEAKKVKSLLKKHKINLHIITNKKAINRNVQGQARKVRYDFLKQFCKKKNIKIILTAHNLEDQVETFFIRLSRGSGLTGLSAMKISSKIDKKVTLMRPLLDTQKKYLKKISKITFGIYFNDPSNKNNKYLRTKIRNLKIPLKKSGIRYEQIFKSINNLASSKATLDEYFDNLKKDLLKKKNMNEVRIDLSRFYDLNNELKIRLINESIKKLKKNYYNPRSNKVLNLIKSLEDKKFKKATLGGCIFLIKKDLLCLKKEENR